MADEAMRHARVMRSDAMRARPAADEMQVWFAVSQLGLMPLAILVSAN
jgi:hypothetical protein